MPETAGFIGLGLMGTPLAGNLLKAGYPVFVHGRSQAPVEELVAAGAGRGEDDSSITARTVFDIAGVE